MSSRVSSLRASAPPRSSFVLYPDGPEHARVDPERAESGAIPWSRQGWEAFKRGAVAAGVFPTHDFEAFRAFARTYLAAEDPTVAESHWNRHWAMQLWLTQYRTILLEMRLATSADDPATRDAFLGEMSPALTATVTKHVAAGGELTLWHPALLDVLTTAPFDLRDAGTRNDGRPMHIWAVESTIIAALSGARGDGSED